jgi:hypothetical protein
MCKTTRKKTLKLWANQRSVITPHNSDISYKVLGFVPSWASFVQKKKILVERGKKKNIYILVKTALGPLPSPCCTGYVVTSKTISQD